MMGWGVIIMNANTRQGWDVIINNECNSRQRCMRALDGNLVIKSSHALSHYVIIIIFLHHHSITPFF